MRTLWIVDDQPLSTVQIAEVFNPLTGFAIKTSTSGKDFLERARRDGYPDVLLLDLIMPEMDGFSVLDALRPVRENHYFPIVVISAVTDKRSVVRALSMGADDFIVKPVFMDELRIRITNMLKIKERDECLNVSLDVFESNLLEKLRMLEGTQIETVLKLGKAAEFRDDETGSHIERMAEYVRLIADHLSIGKDQATMLRYAAPMHDVGKIGIPDGILLKPGKLSDDELKVIHLHTVIGARILSGTTLPLLEVAKEIALSHHEKWDGTGYPLKLKGKDIPLSGRIVTICDVFDAITSNRVYKKAWPIEKALDFIRDHKERHFDPDVTDAFFAVFDAILAIKTAQGDAVEKPMLQQIIDGDVTIDEFVDRWR